jgi:peptide/nickel transport system permease protein
MTGYMLRRLFYAFVLIVLMSIISFIVIQLPPGSFADTYVAQVTTTQMSEERRQALLAEMISRYGLDEPMYMQYLKWVGGIITRFDFGMSFHWNRPVSRIIIERMPLTLVLGVITLIFQFVVAIPVGIYSAVRQYTRTDYALTFLSFIGISVPNFLLALLVMVALYQMFGISMGGLNSPEFREAAMSLPKFLDMMAHMIVPVVVIGLSGTASTVRILRATMLDELGKEYIKVAKAKGLSHWQAVIRHATRIAMNPIIASVGWQLPNIISGALIVSIVLGLPTTGPDLFQALLSQDMYLAGSIILLLSAFTVFGTLLSDILLALTDPRISFTEQKDAD